MKPHLFHICSRWKGYASLPPWNVDDVTREMSKGGACECPRVGGFSIFRRAMTSRGQCPRVVVLVNVLKADGDDVTQAMSKEGCLAL